MKIKVSITDDHPLVITGLQNALNGQEDIELLDTYKNGTSLLEGLKERQPDVLLLDVQLPDIPGNELARTINKEYPEIRILALTSMDTSFHALDMLQHGCTGYLLKHTEHDTLIEAIREVYAGEQYIDASIKDDLLKSMMKTKRQSNKIPVLTEREKEILQLIALGKTSPQIADELFISIRTAENHRFSIMQKLDVKNTAALVTKAIRLGLTR